MSTMEIVVLGDTTGRAAGIRSTREKTAGLAAKLCRSSGHLTRSRSGLSSVQEEEDGCNFADGDMELHCSRCIELFVEALTVE
jgi:hypothetical protein